MAGVEKAGGVERYVLRNREVFQGEHGQMVKAKNILSPDPHPTGKPDAAGEAEGARPAADRNRR